MRAAQQEIPKDGVVIVAISLMFCQIRSRASRVIGRTQQCGSATNASGRIEPDLTPDSRVEKLLL